MRPQRFDECGHRVRPSAYEFTDDDLHGTIESGSAVISGRRRALALHPSGRGPSPGRCSPRT
jgi:hypothetical protein